MRGKVAKRIRRAVNSVADSVGAPKVEYNLHRKGRSVRVTLTADCERGVYQSIKKGHKQGV